jgi:hypothetical protein
MPGWSVDVRQTSEKMVEGSILEHQDDDVSNPFRKCRHDGNSPSQCSGRIEGVVVSGASKNSGCFGTSIAHEDVECTKLCPDSVQQSLHCFGSGDVPLDTTPSDPARRTLAKVSRAAVSFLVLVSSDPRLPPASLRTMPRTIPCEPPSRLPTFLSVTYSPPSMGASLLLPVAQRHPWPRSSSPPQFGAR